MLGFVSPSSPSSSCGGAPGRPPAAGGGVIVTHTDPCFLGSRAQLTGEIEGAIARSLAAETASVTRHDVLRRDIETAVAEGQAAPRPVTFWKALRVVALPVGFICVSTTLALLAISQEQGYALDTSVKANTARMGAVFQQMGALNQTTWGLSARMNLVGDKVDSLTELNNAIGAVEWEAITTLSTHVDTLRTAFLALVQAMQASSSQQQRRQPHHHSNKNNSSSQQQQRQQDQHIIIEQEEVSKKRRGEPPRIRTGAHHHRNDVSQQPYYASAALLRLRARWDERVRAGLSLPRARAAVAHRD